MEFFRNTNIDFLGKKWYFLSFSLVFSVAGILSMMFWHGIPLGVDFRGGTLVYVKFAQAPETNVIRGALDKAGLHNAVIQRYGAAAENEVVIKLDQKETSEADISRARTRSSMPWRRIPSRASRTSTTVTGSVFPQCVCHCWRAIPCVPNLREYDRQARRVLDFRDKDHSGIIKSMDDLKGVVPDRGPGCA